MHLIESLIAGVRGAENGTARLYSRGTSTRATWYSSYEATSASTSDIALDSYGGAEVYVNQPVDVRVLAADGSVIRDFTCGAASSNVEVLSDSFTGVNYSTSASAVSQPITLQAVLNKWNDSAGAPDWKVRFGGVSTNLETVAASMGLFFNVKSPAYGAVGDGTTDDTTAIQAAINAANAAGGGTVFFPPGAYRTTGTLTMYGTVSLLGVGAGASLLYLSHATANQFTWSTGNTAPCSISGLSIQASQANTGIVLNLAALTCGITLRDCVLGSSTYNAPAVGNAIIKGTTGGSVEMTGCVLNLAPCANAYGISALRIRVNGGRFIAGTGTFSTCWMARPADDGFLLITGAEFDLEGCTGVGSQLYAVGSADGAIATVTGCCVHNESGASEYVFYIAADTFMFSEEANNVRTNLPLYNALDYSPVVLGSRASNEDAQITAGGETITIADIDNAVHVLRVTSNGAITLNATASGSATEPPERGDLTVVVYNSSAGATGTITWGTGFLTLPTFTVAAGKTRTFRFKRLSPSVANTRYWIQVGDHSGDIG